VLLDVALRQATGFVEALLELVGLDWPAPNFSIFCCHQNTLVAATPVRSSAAHRLCCTNSL
jgi:hypothetical protein